MEIRIEKTDQPNVVMFTAISDIDGVVITSRQLYNADAPIGVILKHFTRLAEQAHARAKGIVDISRGKSANDR